MPEPVLPDYGGACIDSLAPALLRWRRPAPAWLPEPARDARQIVLLVLDGLGWEQLERWAAAAPVMAGMTGGPITSVAPTTTAAALTSISTGRPPAEHGVVGYRVHVGEGRVMNVLQWRTAEGDAREAVPPTAFQPLAVFDGAAPPVVTRAAFAATGFTEAHLGGVRLHGWGTPSSLVVEVRALLAAGEPFVYAYYDGIDKVAHEYGLDVHYEAELRYADRLVGDLLSELPDGAALVLTSDHGQVDVGERIVPLAPEVAADTAFVSGEGRFRWLHAVPGAADRLAAAAAEAHGNVAWVRSRDQVLEEGWLGGRLRPGVVERLGDVALAAREPISFLDPADHGWRAVLRSRHGSVTAAEMLVPLLAG
ncbi:MAG TPA: alkaline phosphatase family protein [Acidimicrobiales bacterium]|nr:alkaline phosphatase family protein [Acidimicrobiales bacterium]